jgi:hypothetical protein
MPQNIIERLEGLEKNRDDKPDNVKVGIEDHLDPWRRRPEKGMALQSERSATLPRGSRRRTGSTGLQSTRAEIELARTSM